LQAEIVKKIKFKIITLRSTNNFDEDLAVIDNIVSVVLQLWILLALKLVTDYYINEFSNPGKVDNVSNFLNLILTPSI